MADKTIVHFRFDAQVSVEVSDGVELNALQKRIEQGLKQPSFTECIASITGDKGVTNKRVVTDYKGMILGKHVVPDADVKAPGLKPGGAIPRVDPATLQGPDDFPQGHIPEVER